MNTLYLMPIWFDINVETRNSYVPFLPIVLVLFFETFIIFIKAVLKLFLANSVISVIWNVSIDWFVFWPWVTF